MDLAVVVVPVPAVLDVMESCGRKGIRCAIVISAGFKEVGGEGIERKKSSSKSLRGTG